MGVQRYVADDAVRQGPSLTARLGEVRRMTERPGTARSVAVGWTGVERFVADGAARHGMAWTVLAR